MPISLKIAKTKHLKVFIRGYLIVKMQNNQVFNCLIVLLVFIYLLITLLNTLLSLRH